MVCDLHLKGCTRRALDESLPDCPNKNDEIQTKARHSTRRRKQKITIMHR